MLIDKGYLNAEVQKNLFEAANITPDVPYRLNQKNWRPPTWAYKRFRKRIETIFSQLNGNLMMIRNFAKQSCGLFTGMAGKIAAMTFMQYLILLISVPPARLNMRYFNSTDRFIIMLFSFRKRFSQ